MSAPMLQRSLFPRDDSAVSIYKFLSGILGSVCLLLLCLVGWMANAAYSQLNDLQTRTAALEMKVAVSYQVHDQLTATLTKLEIKLDRIDEKLSHPGR